MVVLSERDASVAVLYDGNTIISPPILRLQVRPCTKFVIFVFQAQLL